MKNSLWLILPALLLLSACATTMNKDQCLIADWRTIGYEDGSLGRGEQWLSKRGEACAEHGVAPDLNQYLLGRSDGLQTFCRPRRGFDLGSRGVRYEYVCPPELEEVFLVAYQDGSGLRDRRIYLNQLEDTLATAHVDVDALEQLIIDNTLTLATAQMTNQERIDYALELKNMAEDRGRIQASIPQIQADLDAAHHDLEAYSASIAPKYPGGV
ncbi:MAG: DUF2799 domain-containing protein [Kordiimonadaceae bacterium]|nr:DUF2799 domain-containing protein [Kordiimonadaceae bacterium]